MLSAVQELKLIARCVTFDDRDAFGQLVVAYQDSLKRFLLNLTLGNAVLTDDLAQETFVKAWISIRQFKGISRFKTWLFRIAINEFLTWKRNKESECELNSECLSNFFINDQPRLEAKMDITAAMQELNDKERAVTLLFYLEELPIKKIHQITGYPEGTIKVYLSRSREKLAEIIK